MPAPNNPWPWYMVLLVWSAIGFGVLYCGGFAVIANMALMKVPPSEVCTLWQAIWMSCPPYSQTLLLFSVGGGITIGLLILTWWIVTQRGGFSWLLGIVILGIVLFSIFVWPTPYRYDWAKDKSFVVKINRFSGDITYVPRP
jgi:MFS family permease